jgi:hypothetical protein
MIVFKKSSKQFYQVAGTMQFSKPFLMIYLLAKFGLNVKERNEIS